ncbi:TDT family transporter [Rothia sp. HMSC072E10]|uniref:TDT family transporter n=1 Tax=Rothia sp. HMSC072E10 TaxID=1739448 RepID=UPI0008A56A27|nr:TDT family transporter [Rothia sp. HMSC072E10]OFQ33721.1 potassium-tellurite ethidium and proflavin transporter [Rothia sp. HMSC072E10]
MSSSTQNAQLARCGLSLPVNYFAVALGTGALGAAWRTGASKGMAPDWVGESILAFNAVVWLLLVGFLVHAVVKYRAWVCSFWEHPARTCFFSLIPATTAQVGAALYPYAEVPALTLVVLGAVGQLYFASHRIAGTWRGGHAPEATSPVLYLPTVATNFATATAMGFVGWHDMAMLFFGAGLISWFSIEGAILSRLRTLTPLPQGERGIIGIQMAPPFVGGNAYLAANGGTVDWFFLVLTGYGILQLIFLMRLLPWVLEGGFSMSMWGFSFGMGSMVAGGIRLTAVGMLGFVGPVLTVAGTAFLIFLWAGTLYLAVKGRLLVRPN